ncbi:cytochrome d ubiquinol oxidase subunit II [Leucothrix sargassi]|nr:cytochrome d ubiquinol oxidase subunit II [Leucothrix sargassi]
MTYAEWLPVIFIGLMGFSVLVYAILDGYDLGVGLLLPLEADKESQRDTMIASIGPFWDANETWLVLAIGLLLIAFPSAHSVVLYHLYIPASIMLVGLILRGVAFDFRAKAAITLKGAWDKAFAIGSLITTLSQGYMLGQYVLGFDDSAAAIAFSVLSAVCVTAAYSYIGAAWLIMKTEGVLQQRSIRMARYSGWASFLGVIAVSVVNIWINPEVYSRWFNYPLVMFSILIPALCLLSFWLNDMMLKSLPKENDRHCWVPFVLVVFIFICNFIGLAFSFFPDIVPGQLDIWEAASATESLGFILYGAVIVIPVILFYTVFSYRVFHGKATSLKYY